MRTVQRGPLAVPADIGSGNVVRWAAAINSLLERVADLEGGLDDPVTITPATAPATPATGWVLYVDSGDGNKLKAKASTGTVVLLGTP